MVNSAATAPRSGRDELRLVRSILEGGALTLSSLSPLRTARDKLGTLRLGSWKFLYPHDALHSALEMAGEGAEEGIVAGISRCSED